MSYAPEPKKQHKSWAKKYNAELGVLSVLLGIISIALGFYWSSGSSSQSTGATLPPQPTPFAVPTPVPSSRHSIQESPVSSVQTKGIWIQSQVPYTVYVSTASNPPQSPIIAKNTTSTAFILRPMEHFAVGNAPNRFVWIIGDANGTCSSPYALPLAAENIGNVWVMAGTITQPLLDEHCQHVSDSKIAESDATPARIFEQPKFRDVIFSTSTEMNWHGILSVKVVKIRVVNGNTAITFKVDGSLNDSRDRFIQCPYPNDPRTNIIDSNGKRYNLVNCKPDVPEQVRDYFLGIGGDNPMLYRLEAHESVYVTYLFDLIDTNVPYIDIHFNGIRAFDPESNLPIRVTF